LTSQATHQQIIATIHQQANRGVTELSSADVARLIDASLATIKRHLQILVEEKRLERSGQARATRYSLPTMRGDASTPSPRWSSSARALQQAMAEHYRTRNAAVYDHGLVERYIPNQTCLLTENLASSLFEEGRIPDQQPAGSYARRVLQELLLDLSWESSRLEGNAYSLSATQELFKSGLQDDTPDAIMLLNHKYAIEYMVDVVPRKGLTRAVLNNVHELLMEGLLADQESLGCIRKVNVTIGHSTYTPCQIPLLLDQKLNEIVSHANLIRNPVEAAFFLWVNIPYLQAFEDGNKRMGRMAANIPLMLYNCAPISFLDVKIEDYATAMLGIYERQDFSVARELFAWTYRRSIQKYDAIRKRMERPDPFALRNRQRVATVIQAIVREGSMLDAAMLKLGVDELERIGDTAKFKALVEHGLNGLSVDHCARFKLWDDEQAIASWIERGRPR